MTSHFPSLPPVTSLPKPMAYTPFPEPTAPEIVASLIILGRPAAQPVHLHPSFTIGSDPNSNLRVEDPTVSAQHAVIDRRGDTWILRDVQSSLGVFVNDVQIAEVPLADQDRIRVGEVVLLFRVNTEGETRLTSKNTEWNAQLEHLPAFATTDFPVLLSGPSGSGKEVIARAIHDASKRKNGPYVTINCSALNETLIESELFGHTRGSFTGALQDRKGAFEAARGGTLFLDEIGDLPIALQPKLLRAIENREIRAVGSDRTVSTDVRIIVASHKNLNEQVRLKLFREDLYWRLNVCVIHPPALSARMEDFNDLVDLFCSQMRVRLTPQALECMQNYSWPGNIRELRNVISRAAAYHPGRVVEAEDVVKMLGLKIPLKPEALYLASSSTSDGTKGNLLREIEREMIVRRLIANRGNQRRTAHDLGMPKSTLHDRLKTYSIDLNQIKSSIG